MLASSPEGAAGGESRKLLQATAGPHSKHKGGNQHVESICRHVPSQARRQSVKLRGKGDILIQGHQKRHCSIATLLRPVYLGDPKHESEIPEEIHFFMVQEHDLS